MSLTKKTGVLAQLGPSMSDVSDTKYSYVELGDEMLKSVRLSSNLNGKLTTSLGQPITVYLWGSYLIGIEIEEGKIYTTDGPSFFMYLSLVITSGGFLFSLVQAARHPLFAFSALGAGLLAFFCWYLMRPLWAAQSIPNAIVIPR